MASVLILECFVMISPDDGIEIAKREQQYAAEAAVDWKKRMIREGGLRHADEVDARGLLLLISGFGIEDHVFTIQDILHLIRASNVKGIATALRRSAFLIPKVTEVIYSLVNTNLEIEAVDIAYTFGLEHTCHPGKILTAYLQNKIKDFQNASPLQMLEATKQHIFDLTLVKQCLESHNVDPSTLLPDFKINERIQNLEKEVNDWKLIQKRKSQESPIHQEAKRACYVHENTPHHHKPVDHFGMDRFNRSTQPSTSYITKHPASPVYNAYARPENRNGSVPNGPAGGFRGSYDQTVHTANNQPHGWHAPYGQHYPRHGQTYDSQPDHRLWDQGQLESFPGFLGSRPPPSDLYGFAKLVEKGWRGSRA
ncbi:protein FRIGIDA-like [Bidens hawaiensis]|uniref:protein FRIGIDA-like n=1 Tax=Bidens hawaiensis TaxID=980011 RepID=UPI00404AD8E9